MIDNIPQNEIAVIPFPKKLLVSCITKSKGQLTKIIRLDPVTGKIIKDGSECSIASGTIKIIPVSSPVGFARLLRTRATNQAIVHGLPAHQEAKVVKNGKLDNYPHQKNGLPVISRTKDFISYADQPGLLLFDHDKARQGSIGSDQALKTYSPQELISCLTIIHPALSAAAWVSTPSTSSCIYDAEGHLLRGEGTGSHVYLFAQKASDIPRYLSILGKYLFLARLGRIEISSSGALLQRTIIDLSVGSPERLDFVAGAVCEDGLVQKLPEPTVHNGDMLDTSTLPDLTAEQETEYARILASLQEEAKPSQAKVSSEYIELESSKIAASRNITTDEARQVIESRQNHVLADDDILYFSHLKGGITVADVLLTGDSFNGKSLADPLEPEYEGGSKTKAIYYWNNGHPKINSFAHGGSVYSFERFKKKEKAQGQAEGKKENRIYPISLEEFLSLEFPPRTNLLSPWLPSQGLAMVFAYRGIGKTHFGLGVAYAVSSGGSFLGWQAPEPAGVLYIDGEMPGPVMQERLSTIITSNYKQPAAPFILLTPDLQPEGMPRLDTDEGQEAIEGILTDRIKLIVVDNISTLSGAKENEADGWTPIQSWALKQRTKGRSVLFVHHGGKGGQQRGTSRREDVLDTSIALRRPVDYKPDQGAVFEIHFEKARGIYGEDVKSIEASLSTDEHGCISWLTRTVEDRTFDRVVQMLNDGLKQNEIAEGLSLHKSNVSRHARKAKAEGLVKL